MTPAMVFPVSEPHPEVTAPNVVPFNGPPTMKSFWAKSLAMRIAPSTPDPVVLLSAASAMPSGQATPTAIVMLRSLRRFGKQAGSVAGVRPDRHLVSLDHGRTSLV